MSICWLVDSTLGRMSVIHHFAQSSIDFFVPWLGYVFPLSSNHALSRLLYGHTLILFNTNESLRRPAIICLENIWLQHPQFSIDVHDFCLALSPQPEPSGVYYIQAIISSSFSKELEFQQISWVSSSKKHCLLKPFTL